MFGCRSQCQAKPSEAKVRSSIGGPWSCCTLLSVATCWDQALHLLPCAMTQTASHITMEGLWQLTGRYHQECSGHRNGREEDVLALLHRMQLKSSMLLDILSQDLPTATDRYATNYYRCWWCWSCRSTRSRIHRLAGTMVPLWRHYVWRDPPSTLPLHKARVLFHPVFAAFIFGYSE
ncbi:hypothetical protein GWK47_046559 [Chionoecetes opilio]|uniref:Uncharacterized protein n=1 Tax=Chionoecetes opilio TaxID=41210 RepID=A0A8J5CUT6_CHIOP|nr:hypothetical protein GWK47_046559 [Chionoecetes opilio]